MVESLKYSLGRERPFQGNAAARFFKAELLSHPNMRRQRGPWREFWRTNIPAHLRKYWRMAWLAR